MQQLTSLSPSLNGLPPVGQPLTYRIRGSLDPDKLNGIDYALQLQYSLDGGGTWRKHLTRASAGVTPYNFSWAHPDGLVAYSTPRTSFGGWEVTRDVQFLTKTGGDGVGYQDYYLPAGNAVMDVVWGHIDGFPQLPLPTHDSDGNLVWEVVTSPTGVAGGVLRIHNTKATTSGQDIELDFSCDQVWVRPTLRTIKFRVVLFRTKDGAGMAISDEYTVQATAGSCPTTGCVTHQTIASTPITG
jgi:hypothetical protein